VINNLVNLQSLFLLHNALTGLPKFLEGLTSLKSLHLQNNILPAVPPSVSHLTSLTQLQLSNNRIGAVPHFLFLSTCLTDLAVTNNQVAIIPATLAFTSQIQKLAVLGNPLVVPDATAVSLGLKNILSALKLPYKGKEVMNRFKLIVLGTNFLSFASCPSFLALFCLPFSLPLSSLLFRFFLPVPSIPN
jgi:Leucine-rich repeat (LRR) protein